MTDMMAQAKDAVDLEHTPKTGSGQGITVEALSAFVRKQFSKEIGGGLLKVEGTEVTGTLSGKEVHISMNPAGKVSLTQGEDLTARLRDQSFSNLENFGHELGRRIGEHHAWELHRYLNNSTEITKRSTLSLTGMVVKVSTKRGGEISIEYYKDPEQNQHYFFIGTETQGAAGHRFDNKENVKQYLLKQLGAPTKRKQ